MSPTTHNPIEDEESRNHLPFEPSWVTKSGSDAWSYAWSKRSALKVIRRQKGFFALMLSMLLFCFDTASSLKLRMFCSWKENFLVTKTHSIARKRFLPIYKARKGLLRLVCLDPVNNIFKLKLRVIYLWKENFLKRKYNRLLHRHVHMNNKAVKLEKEKDNLRRELSRQRSFLKELRLGAHILDEPTGQIAKIWGAVCRNAAVPATNTSMYDLD